MIFNSVISVSLCINEAYLLMASLFCLLCDVSVVILFIENWRVIMAVSGQKFVGRNRAPRVQIEYDTELYGSEKKTELPFVMGVMSDLSGKSDKPLPTIAERKFKEIDVDNFEETIEDIKPKVDFIVPNTLTGQGNLSVKMEFTSMDDFSPDQVAKKVSGLSELFQARQQLANLLTYMDGKAGAEALIKKILSDNSLLGALASVPKPPSNDA